jgi:trypsin
MSRKFISLVVIALTVVSGVITAVPASAVTYGDPVEAPQIEFPEVVPVWVGGTSLCTGTLITQQVVLTAAHCVYGQAGPFQISVGGSTLNSGRLIDVDATWYHPRYDSTYNQNDIGLLHLKTPANVSRLGKLPSNSLKSVGKKFLIVGWGTDQNGSITGKLNRLTLNDQTAASKKNFRGIFNPKTMIGAGRYFPDEILYGGGCTGDSGGPLYMGAKGAGRTVIGLTAFGASGCTVYKPTIFTRIDFYLAAIKRGISLLNSRATASPIISGKATPVGNGPTTTLAPTTTTTTTTVPKKPFSINMTRIACTTQWTYGGNGRQWVMCSLQTTFDTGDGTNVTKLCLSVDGSPFVDEANMRTITNQYREFDKGAVDGCIDAIKSISTSSWNSTPIYGFTIEDASVGNGIAVGIHSASFTVFDAKGRQASVSADFIRCSNTCGFTYSDGSRAY